MLRSLAERENVNREYVSLDDLNIRDMAKNDPALFLQIHKPPVLIDEVQYAPELFTYIKIYIDEHHNPGDFWMTGSQSRAELVIGTGAVLCMAEQFWAFDRENLIVPIWMI